MGCKCQKLLPYKPSIIPRAKNKPLSNNNIQSPQNNDIEKIIGSPHSIKKKSSQMNGSISPPRKLSKVQSKEDNISPQRDISKKNIVQFKVVKDNDFHAHTDKIVYDDKSIIKDPPNVQDIDIPSLSFVGESIDHNDRSSDQSNPIDLIRDSPSLHIDDRNRNQLKNLEDSPDRSDEDENRGLQRISTMNKKNSKEEELLFGVETQEIKNRKSARGTTTLPLKNKITINVVQSNKDVLNNSAINRSYMNDNSIHFESRDEFTSHYKNLKSKFAVSKNKKSNILKDLTKGKDSSVLLGIEESGNNEEQQKSMKSLKAENISAVKLQQKHKRSDDNNLKKVKTGIHIVSPPILVEPLNNDTHHQKITQKPKMDLGGLNLELYPSYSKSATIDVVKRYSKPSDEPSVNYRENSQQDAAEKSPRGLESDSSDQETVKFEPRFVTAKEGDQIFMNSDDCSSIGSKEMKSVLKESLIAEENLKDSIKNKESINNTMTFRADKESANMRESSDKRGMPDNSKTVFTFARSSLGKGETNGDRDLNLSPSINQDRIARVSSQGQSYMKPLVADYRPKVSPEISFTGSPNQSIIKTKQNRFQPFSQMNYTFNHQSAENSNLLEIKVTKQ